MTLKILTLNLWNGGRLLPAALEFLHEQDADIMFLQEVYNGHGEHLEERFRTADVLQAEFPEHQAAFSACYLDTREKEGEIEDGQLLLSRWPLSQPERIFLDVPYGKFDQDGVTDYSNFPALIQKAQTEIAGQTITLLNVHGPVNLDGLEDDARRQMLRKRILANLGERSIVAGDFNARAESVTFQELEQHLQNVFAGQLPTTFNVARKNLEQYPGYADSVVDGIFLSPGISVLDWQSPQVDVSDHLPLVATIELK